MSDVVRSFSDGTARSTWKPKLTSSVPRTGSGELTSNLAKLVGGGRVVGIDASADMIDKACTSSTGGASGSAPLQLEFAVVDGQQLTEWLVKTGKTATFDRVFSSAAVSAVFDSDHGREEVLVLTSGNVLLLAPLDGQVSAKCMRRDASSAQTRRDSRHRNGRLRQRERFTDPSKTRA